MPKLENMSTEPFGTHLLLIGHSKTGKSRYLANAAIDGYTVFYMDADNGRATLMHLLKDKPEAMARVIFVDTSSPYLFFKEFTERPTMRWNMTQDRVFSSATAKSDDTIVELKPGKIPKGVIVSFDSWSSIALDCMRYVADDKSLSIEAMGNESQKVYGEAGTRLTSGLLILQKVQFHVVVQAHVSYYERQEKPTGKQSGKQQDMIVKETIEIPLSCSKPHGFNMVKFFNEVGTIGVDRFEKFQLDFRQKYDRLGGGSAGNIGDPESEYRFSRLFGGGNPPPRFTDEQLAEWWREYPASEYVPPTKTSTAATPQPSNTAAGNAPTSNAAASGAKPFALSLKK